jgi:2,4-dienoyl-CoA reductase-like NADH-dependent reductase (Old Yellow Enzyme family)
MTPPRFASLFSPFRLGHLEAPNRIVSTSHGTNMAVDGAPSERLIAYHAAKAAGGCGTVMMFGSASPSRMTRSRRITSTSGKRASSPVFGPRPGR